MPVVPLVVVVADVVVVAVADVDDDDEAGGVAVMVGTDGSPTCFIGDIGTLFVMLVRTLVRAAETAAPVIEPDVPQYSSCILSVKSFRSFASSFASGPA